MNYNHYLQIIGLKTLFDNVGNNHLQKKINIQLNNNLNSSSKIVEFDQVQMEILNMSINSTNSNLPNNTSIGSGNSLPNNIINKTLDGLELDRLNGLDESNKSDKLDRLEKSVIFDNFDNSDDSGHSVVEHTISSENGNKNENETEVHIPQITQQKIVIDDNKESKINVYNIVDKMYILFIFILISWKVVFAIMYAYLNNDLRFIIRNLFDCAIPIQYIIGIRYFGSSHFESIMDRARTFHEDHYNKYLHIYTKIIASFSVIFAIIELILLIMLKHPSGTDIYSTLYNPANKVERCFLSILYFVSNIYSINIFFSNVFAFSVVFRIHSLDIQSFYDKVKNNNYIVSEMCNNYIRLRNDYEYSVEKLNFTFSTIVLIGGISTYINIIDIKDGKITSSQIMYSIAFILIMLIYLKSILVLKSSRDDIGSIAYSNRTVEKLLTRHEIHGSITSNSNLDISSSAPRNNTNEIRSAILDTENADTLDWLVQYTIMGGKWDTFKLFGFEFDDLALFKKGAILILMFYLSSDITKLF
jgi:hypothetical protein